MVNFHSLRGIYVPYCRKFQQIVPNGRTHKGESLGPYGLQPGTNKKFGGSDFLIPPKKLGVAMGVAMGVLMVDSLRVAILGVSIFEYPQKVAFADMKGISPENIKTF